MNEEWLIGFYLLYIKKSRGGGCEMHTFGFGNWKKGSNQVIHLLIFKQHGWLHLSVSLCLTPRLACLFFKSFTVNLFIPH